MPLARPRCCGRQPVGWLGLFFSLLPAALLVYLLLRPFNKGHIDVRPMAQLHSMDAALELFNSEFNHYPPSEANDPAGQPYCGAMKLAEAMMGQDLLGCPSNSVFSRDGISAAGMLLYPSDISTMAPALQSVSLKDRRGPFLPPENANAFRLADIYGKGKTGPFLENSLVLCDTFARERRSGTKTGMPILYYRANPAGTMHDVNNPDNPQNIYSYKDNLALINLGVPGDPNAVHPLADPRRFYLNTQSDKRGGPAQPYRKDSFILISPSLNPRPLAVRPEELRSDPAYTPSGRT
jgi:hypothetical protein